MKRFVLIAAAAVATGAALWALLGLGGDGGASGPRRAHHTPSYAQLVASNYRVLSPRRSHELLRFAEAFTACAEKSGAPVGRPHVLPVKIVIPLTRAIPMPELARIASRCGDRLGGPPQDASLVQPRGAARIELYLPKRCLLDPKVLRKS